MRSVTCSEATVRKLSNVLSVTTESGGEEWLSMGSSIGFENIEKRVVVPDLRLLMALSLFASHKNKCNNDCVISLVVLWSPQHFFSFDRSLLLVNIFNVSSFNGS